MVVDVAAASKAWVLADWKDCLMELKAALKGVEKLAVL